MKRNITWKPLGPVKSMLMLAFIFAFLIAASLAAPVSAPLWIATALLIIWLLLLKSPLNLRLSPEELSLRTPLRVKKFPLAEIQDIVSLNGRNDISPMFGMNGICGYTGILRLSDIPGKCVCYYGDYEECFLLTMKSGRRYVLSCDGHRSMVEAVSNMIGNRMQSRGK